MVDIILGDSAMIERIKERLKTFIKGRWFPLVVALLVLITGIGVAFCCGFRITYAPELENSWEAISAVASWAGIIVSIASAVAAFMAVWYAIQVADKQNQIAMFEKKYELYALVHYCEIFADMAKKAKSREDIKEAFLAAFSDIKIAENIPPDGMIAKKFVLMVQKMEQLQFLVEGKSEEDARYLADLGGAINSVIVEYFEDTEFEVPNSNVQKLVNLTTDPRYDAFIADLSEELTFK